MTFHAYPKWITLPDGKRLIVQDAEEEKSYLIAPDTMDAQHDNVLMEEAEGLRDGLHDGSSSKNDLLQRAESIGLKTDGRWSDARLASEVEKAESAK